MNLKIPGWLKWPTAIGIIIAVLLLLAIAIPRFGNTVEGLSSTMAGVSTGGASYPMGSAPYKASSESGLDNRHTASKATADMAQASPPPNQPQTAPGEILKPQLIIEAHVQMKVDQLTEAVNRVEKLVDELGGYITRKNLAMSEYEGHYRNASLTIRLPQAHLDPFMRSAGGIGQITNEQISATDVSKQLVDTEARIRNLQAEEKQLQAIMNRAGKIPEVLEAARELARVRGEIEMAQGALNYLKSQVAFSTIDLDLSEKVLTPAANVRPGIPTVVANALQQSWDDLYGFALWLTGGGIWLALSLLPRASVLFLLVWVGIVLGRRVWPHIRQRLKP